MANTTPLPRGSVIGIFGGGQLGRMAALAAAPLGYRCHVFCPDPHSPAFQVADGFTCAPYTDLDAVKTFADSVDLVTFEFENIPYETVQCCMNRVPLRPGIELLQLSQNRLREKAFAQACGVPVPQYAEVRSLEHLRAAVQAIGTPGILKTQEMGYDGKGQRGVEATDDLPRLWDDFGGEPAIYEERIPLYRELSVILARGVDGQIASFPVADNEHQRGVLRRSIAPAALAQHPLKMAREYTHRLAEKAGLVGLLSVEYFLSEEGHLFFNEMAPRPHNSGHWTLDGCHTHQFAQFIRAITGLPLGDVIPHSYVCMVNLLGGDIQHRDASLIHGNVCWHDYGKQETRPGRKMGHVNFVGVDALEASSAFLETIGAAQVATLAKAPST